jgi:23S rRNA pseudouridine1911/1915/1917 synthase
MNHRDTKVFEITVAPDDEHVLTTTRWDRYLSQVLEGMSRNQIQENLISLTVNGKAQRLSAHVKSGDVCRLILQKTLPSELIPRSIDLDILFENSDVIVINKPRGLVVHPGAGNRDYTLVHGIIHYLQQQGEKTMEGTDRPGIVHRLDKETTGVMVIAKNPQTHEYLAKQFSQRTTKKIYLALSSIHQSRVTQLANYFEPKLLETVIGRSEQNRQIYRVLEPNAQRGKVARTMIQIVGLNPQKGLGLFRLGLLTGRTHQIRVHLRHVGYPIIGDRIYGDREFHSLPMLLHAAKLTIQLPGETEPITFRAEPPKDFLEFLDSHQITGIEK